MAKSQFVYVTFIRTTPEKLWEALTTPALMKKFWGGMCQESRWEVGEPWKLVGPDGQIKDAGEVLEADPPRKLVLSWRNEFRPELKAEGFARMSYEIEATKDKGVKLTVIHQSDVGESKLIKAVSGGWPTILSSLKSLLETGEPLWQATAGCAS